MLRLALLLLTSALLAAAVPGMWTVQISNITSRLRGVSVVSDSVAWASGSAGSFLRTTDGGAHWESGSVADAEKLDFRDVHAIDANTAYVMSIGSGENSRIYKTTDGGHTWALQFKNANPKAFFDGIAFWDPNNAIAFSDPVDGHFVIIRTVDGGVHWTEVPAADCPAAVTGEAAFAASGTSITVQGSRNVWIATGGGAARVFRSTDRGATWAVASTPVISGESAGIFSINFRDDMNGVIVGGDYRKEKEPSANFATTADGGHTWTVGSQLAGYRSAVSYVRAGARWDLIASGPSGSDYSSDGGATWTPIDTTGYDTLSFLLDRPVGFAAGQSGRVAKWTPSGR